MATSSVASSSSSSQPSNLIFRPPPPVFSIISTRFQLKTTPPFRFHLQASRRPPNFRQDGESSAVDPSNRNWNRNDMSFIGDYDDDIEDDEDEEDDESDRSLDLLIQFVENVYKKISRRARKAVRSVLPINIPTKLVGFSVNGVLILAFLWILRAFLGVVCTLGSVVFVSILLVRGIWTGISYFQEGPNRRTWSDFNDENDAWTGTRPAT